MSSGSAVSSLQRLMNSFPLGWKRKQWRRPPGRCSPLQERAGLQDGASHNSKHSPRLLITPPDCANIVRHSMPAGELIEHSDNIWKGLILDSMCSGVHMCDKVLVCVRVFPKLWPPPRSVFVSPSHALGYICIPIISEAHVH